MATVSVTSGEPAGTASGVTLSGGRIVPVVTSGAERYGSSTSTRIRFSVSVPVLSEQIQVTDPSVSTAGSRRTSALWWAIRRAPRARVTATTAGRASGTAATARLIAVRNIRPGSSPRSSPVTNTTAQMATTASAIRPPKLDSRRCRGVRTTSAVISRSAMAPSSVSVPVPTTTPRPRPIRAAGRVGLPIIEYNFYAHRATEGYFNEPGRAGAGMLSFDYEKIKDLPPLPQEGAHSIEEMWSNVTYFLKAVVPVAKESNVRLALHPNDPPAPISRGSGQIMGSVEGWKRLVDIVPSPYNGITFDCGVTREMGHDPVDVCRYFGKKDCINHVHFRNVITKVPREKYTEVFPDEGEVNMFAVMKELVRQKYPRLIYPEHPRGLDADREVPNSGQYAAWVFNVAYTRAILQAAMESV